MYIFFLNTIRKMYFLLNWSRQWNEFKKTSFTIKSIYFSSNLSGSGTILMAMIFRQIGTRFKLWPWAVVASLNMFSFELLVVGR